MPILDAYRKWLANVYIDTRKNNWVFFLSLRIPNMHCFCTNYCTLTAVTLIIFEFRIIVQKIYINSKNFSLFLKYGNYLTNKVCSSNEWLCLSSGRITCFKDYEGKSWIICYKNSCWTWKYPLNLTTSGL